MAHFDKGGGVVTPFGDNEFLRSTQDVKRTPYTFAAAQIPTETIDGVSQKVLKPGEVLCKITSGGDAGKVGVFMRGTPVAEVQTATITGTPAGGTFRLSYRGAVTAAIAYNAAASAVQTALNALSTVQGTVAVSGSAGGPYTITFSNTGESHQLVLDTNSLTGGTNPSVTIATTTPGTSGQGTGASAIGLSDPRNIVGINDTFLPWQLLVRDVEVATVYEATVVQAWCFERDATGARVALSNATANEMQVGGAAGKSVSLLFV